MSHRDPLSDAAEKVERLDDTCRQLREQLEACEKERATAVKALAAAIRERPWASEVLAFVAIPEPTT